MLLIKLENHTYLRLKQLTTLLPSTPGQVSHVNQRSTEGVFRNQCCSQHKFVLATL